MSSFETGHASQIARRSKISFEKEKPRRPEEKTVSSQNGWWIPFIPMTEIGILDDNTRRNMTKWRHIVNANPTAMPDELDELVLHKMRPAPAYQSDDDLNTGRNKWTRHTYYADKGDRQSKRNKHNHDTAGRRDIPQPQRQRQSSKYDRPVRNTQLARRTELAMRMILGGDSPTDTSDDDAGYSNESMCPKAMRRAMVLTSDRTLTEDEENNQDQMQTTTKVRKYGHRAAERS